MDAFYFLVILIFILVVFGVYVALTSSPVTVMVTSWSPSLLYPDKSTIAFILLSSISLKTSFVPFTITVVFIDDAPIAAAL